MSSPWLKSLLFIVLELIAGFAVCGIALFFVQYGGYIIALPIIIYILGPATVIGMISRTHFRLLGREADFRTAAFLSVPSGCGIIFVILMIAAVIGMIFPVLAPYTEIEMGEAGYYMLWLSLPVLVPVAGLNAGLLLRRKKAPRGDDR